MIMGSVRTVDNKPVANARVVVASLMQGQQLAAQYTLQDGSFTVSNLREGDYEVRAESGVQEATERVHVNDGGTWVVLRMPNGAVQGQGSGGSAVSVQQLRVPDKAASLLAKAHHALSNNRLAEAAKYVAKALVAYPEYAQALALRGVLELQQSHFGQAAADANHAIQADPNDGTGYLIMGAALNCQEKFQDALRPLQQAETLMPNVWQGYFESSKALLQLGKFQQSLQQVNKAMALTDASKHPDLHLVKGYAYAGLHSYGGAVDEFQQYVTQVPDGPYTAKVRASLEKLRPLTNAPAR